MISVPVIFLSLYSFSRNFSWSPGFPHSAKPFRDIYPLLVRLFVIKNFENSFLFVITFRSTAERAPSGPQWSRDPDTDVINRVPETTLAVNSELPEASCCREFSSPPFDNHRSPVPASTEYQSESKISLHGSVEHVPSPSPAGFFGDPLGFLLKKRTFPRTFSAPYGGSVRDA